VEPGARNRGVGDRNWLVCGGAGLGGSLEAAQGDLEGARRQETVAGFFQNKIIFRVACRVP
jgi:hypothetical protein